MRVEVPIYGLALQHIYREAYPFLTDVCQQLLADVDASVVTSPATPPGAGWRSDWPRRSRSPAYPSRDAWC